MAGEQVSLAVVYPGTNWVLSYRTKGGRGLNLKTGFGRRAGVTGGANTPLSRLFLMGWDTGL